MVKIKTESEFNDLIDREIVTVAIFRAEWCPDCSFIDSFIETLAKEYEPEVKTIEINTEELSSVTSKYDVYGIPSFISFKNGKELNRLVNRARKSRTEIDIFYKESL